MDDSAPRPLVEEPAGWAPDHPADARGTLIPGQIRGGVNASASAFAPAPTPAAAPAPVPVPASVPGAFQWTPFPGPRNGSYHGSHHSSQPGPLYGLFPYRDPRDPFGIWPHPTADLSRDRHTAAIAVCSLLAAFTTLIAAATLLPDRYGRAHAVAEAGTPVDSDPGPPSGGYEDPRHEPGGTATPPPTAGETKEPGLKGPSASSAARNTVLTRVHTLAAGRTTALRNNDAAAFVQAVDKNNKTLVANETRLFGNLRKVPFDRSDWSAGTVADARTDPGASGGWPVSATVNISFTHKIGNADVRPVAERYIWTVRCLSAADACSITNVAGGRDTGALGASGYPAPWDIWDLVVERRPHVVVMGPADIASDLRTRADEAEAAAQYDLTTWTGGTDTSPGFVVALTRERTVFESLYSRESPGDWAAGFALPLTAAGESGSVGGSRVVIDLDEMDHDAAFAKVILRHELVHALLDPVTRVDYDRIPLWAAEGFADWVAQSDRSIRGTYEGREVASQIKDGRFKGALPTDADFNSDDENTIDDAYNQSHLAVRYLADTYGAAKACTFIADVYRGTSKTVDGAIRAATGKSLAEFEKGWAEWTRANFG